MKRTWKMINTAIGKKSTVRNPTIDNLTVDNQRVTSDDNIALKFNNYFVNIGKSLRNKSQHHSTGRGKKHMKYLKKNIKTAFINLLLPRKKLYIVNDFKSNTSSGYDFFFCIYYAKANNS